jgi:hypothetical protein
MLSLRLYWIRCSYALATFWQTLVAEMRESSLARREGEFVESGLNSTRSEQKSLDETWRPLESDTSC